MRENLVHPFLGSRCFETDRPYPNRQHFKSDLGKALTLLGQETNGQASIITPEVKQQGASSSQIQRVTSQNLWGQQAQPLGINPEILKQVFGSVAASSKPGNGPPRSTTPPVTVVERPVRITLEELFKGCHKKMKIKRRVFDEVTGRRATQDKILEFDIKPGLKKGSKIKFKGVGDEEEGGQQDLHFIVEEVSKTIPVSTLNSSK